MMDYPKAKIPTDPVLSSASFGATSGTPRVRSVLDAGQCLQVTSGRMAIGLALREMGIGPGDQVLMPAYHSRSMIEPLLWFGAEPVFYRVRPDTTVDLDDVTAKLSAACKVLVVVNYFGFPQDLVKLRAYCDAHQLAMLEDCAHAFMGEHDGQALGSFGDYAIASTMKFLPVVDGGCLISARHRLDHVRLISAGMRFELKTVANTLERAFAYGRLHRLEALLRLPMALTGQLWRKWKAVDKQGMLPIGPKASEGAFGFEAAWLDKRASLASRWILKTVSIDQAGAARRRHYLLLRDALAGLPGCAALYPHLPEGVYPWVFPLRVANPTTVFPLLKNAGVPVVRFAEFLWDGVDASICAASIDLSRSIMQFPCHQALRMQELDWMIEQIKLILTTASRESAGTT